MLHLSINNITSHGFNFFQDKVLESAKNNSKQIVAIALIALSCLAALYIAFECCCCDDDYSYDPLDVDPHHNPYLSGKASILSGSSMFPQDKILQLEPEEVEENFVDLSSLQEEKKLIKELKKNWLDDPQKELQRIIDAKIFPSAIQSVLPQPSAFQGVQGIFSVPVAIQAQMFSVMGRVLEIKNLYRHTHYVFTHGQDPEISIANQIMKRVVRTFTPLLHHPFKIPFRLPLTVTYSENADEFINQYQATEQSIGFNDATHSDKMLSVDAQFWNTQKMESALDFFSTASNIIRGDMQLLAIFRSIFLNYLPNDAVCNMLAEKAIKIAKQKKAEAQVGVLYAICIPKDIIQDEKKNFAYPCHPFGKKCECFPSKDRVQLLEAMQKNKHVICKGGYFTQYRILTSRLTEEKDVRIFAVDALSKDKRKFYRNQVKELVKELTLYSHLSALIEKLDKDPFVIDQINSLVESSPQLDQKYIQQLLTVKESFQKNQRNPLPTYFDDFDLEEEIV